MQYLAAWRLPLEHVYSDPFTPFETVNAAVWYTLCLAQSHRHHQPEQTPAGMRYHLSYGQVLADLFVLRVTKRTTTVSIHLLGPIDPIEAMIWRKHGHVGEAADGYLALLKMIDEQLHRLIGQAARAEGYAPPPPATIEEIIAWWHLYFPEKPPRRYARSLRISTAGISQNEHSTTRSRSRSPPARQQQTKKGENRKIGKFR
jgi:hypothetical protein